MRCKLPLSSLIILPFLFAITCFSQEAKPFKVRHQKYVKGDMTMIANNIVNTTENGNNPNNPYNDRSIKGKLNDECTMSYIDIDHDESTFSSSSADLLLENGKNKKIVYAGLYWSATYIYNSGKITSSNKYKAKDSKRESFDKIKIKLPNQETYKDISGELIFDGKNNPNFSESAPYVMFADITNLVTPLKNPSGTYTIANIKSTIGKISGGISAGWSIVFIYEDANMTGKFITCYDGFAGITDKSLDINFSGFQTLPQGNVNAKIACAALEGDLKLKGDQLQFKSSQNTDFVQLSNSLRDKSNIFNSSITVENSEFTTRNPNSKNTLGYDSFIMAIDNPDNSVIGNDTREATVRLKTYGDRYFMFFTAFSVEVIKPEAIDKEINSNLIVDNSSEKIKSKPLDNSGLKSKSVTNVSIENEKNLPATSKNFDNVALTKKNVEKNNAENNSSIASNNLVKNDVAETFSKPRITPIESKSVTIPSASQGYYIIANVFAVHANATRFVATLKKKGIIADYFINPLNNYRYVYVSNNSNFDDAKAYYNSNLDGKYYDALWIMTVNKENNSSFAYNNISTSKKSDENSLKLNNIGRANLYYARFLFPKTRETDVA